MAFPSDVHDSEWNPDNLQRWKDPRVTELNRVRLLPLEAKALHVIGTLVQIFDAAGYLLYCGAQNRPYANYYLYAYLLACTAVELLGRCRVGEAGLRSTLGDGLREVGLGKVTVNVMRDGQPYGHPYSEEMLCALRNLAAHRQAVASAGGQRHDVLLHVELLDSFPGKLMAAFDEYYAEVFQSPDPGMRRKLAKALVEPVLYSDKSGQVYVSPIRYAYKNIYKLGKKPSEVLKYTDWQVYNPERDRKLRQ